MVIEKEDTALYSVFWPQFHETPTYYESLSAAIAHASQEIPEELAKYVNISYKGCQLETTAVYRLSAQAEALANRLVCLVAEIHQDCLPALR